MRLFDQKAERREEEDVGQLCLHGCDGDRQQLVQPARPSLPTTPP